VVRQPCPSIHSKTPGKWRKAVAGSPHNEMSAINPTWYPELCAVLGLSCVKPSISVMLVCPIRGLQWFPPKKPLRRSRPNWWSPDEPSSSILLSMVCKFVIEVMEAGNRRQVLQVRGGAHPGGQDGRQGSPLRENLDIEGAKSASNCLVRHDPILGNLRLHRIRAVFDGHPSRRRCG